MGEAPPLLRAVVAAERDAGIRLAGPAAGEGVAGELAAVPRLGRHVGVPVHQLVRVPVGGEDGADIEGELRAGGGGAGGGGAVVRDGGRRHGFLHRESCGDAEPVRPQGDVVHRGELGERGAERRPLVRDGVRGRGLRRQLPAGGGAREDFGRMH